MAIFQIQSLFLLVSLFVLPALSVEFKNCTSFGKYSASIESVNISPDTVELGSNANISITADTSKKISDGVTVTVKLIDFRPVFTHTFPLCDVTRCPVAPGSVVFDFPNISTPATSRRDYLTGIVSINAEKEKVLKETILCVRFRFNVKKQLNYASA